MSHTHNHQECCKHENIYFCPECLKPYCEDCGKEWDEPCKLDIITSNVPITPYPIATYIGGGYNVYPLKV